MSESQTSSGPIRVVLADDQALVRGALVALLSLEEGIDVVGQAGRGDELVALVDEVRPDVALIDTVHFLDPL